MPRIQMANMPGSVKAIDHSARATGVPEDFAMAKSKGILKAAEGLNNMGEQVGDAMVDYAKTKWKINKALEEKEDDLAIQQAENAYYKKQLDLQNRMRENPNQNTEFGKWAEDVDAEWEAEEAQYTERMSENARQRYSLAMSKLRYKSVQENNTISTMARTANLYNGEKTLINDDIRTGNFDSAISRLDNAQNGEIKLFSDEEVRKYKEEIIPLSRELKEVEMAENNNDFTMIDKLKSANEDGSYQNFVKIPADQRRQLIQRLKEKQAKLQTDNYNGLLVKNANGERITLNEIQDLYDKGGLNASGYSAMVRNIQNDNMVNYQTRLIEIYTSEEDENKIKEKIDSLLADMNNDVKTNNLRQEQVNVFTSQLAQKKGGSSKNITATNKTSADVINQVKGQIMLLDMPHPNNLNLVRSAWMTEIQKAFPDDLKTQADLIDLLNKELNDDPLEKSELGKDVKAYIKNIFTDLGTKGKNDTDNDEWGYYEDQNIVYAWQYDALYIARQLINKPGITMADIRTKIDEAVKFAAEKDIPRLINRANRIINPATYGKIYNGRTARQYISPGFMPRIVTESIIPKGHISPEQIVKKYNGKDNFDNEVEFWDIKNLDGSISTIIAEDYETLN